MKNLTLAALLLLQILLLPACAGQGEKGESSSSRTLLSSTVPSGSPGPSAAPAAPEASGEASAQDSSLPAASAASGPTAPNASSAPQKAQTVSVTIPEGFTLSQIGDQLEARGVCKKADFVKAAQTYDFSYYPLVKKLAANPNRCYRLEGYLYPNTYQFYLNMKPQDAVGKFLRVAEREIDGTYAYPGMTTDKVVTLASIIEKEADNTEDMKKVSSVFHNRLKAKMILQADSTRDYCNTYLVPLFGDRYNKYYNTYPNRCAGLPAGPICNPGAAALEAAAHPADTDYLYFATATNHKFYYGKTMEERNAQMEADHVQVLYAD